MFQPMRELSPASNELGLKEHLKSTNHSGTHDCYVSRDAVQVMKNPLTNLIARNCLKSSLKPGMTCPSADRSLAIQTSTRCQVEYLVRSLWPSDPLARACGLNTCGKVSHPVCCLRTASLSSDAEIWMSLNSTPDFDKADVAFLQYAHPAVVKITTGAILRACGAVLP